MLGSNVIQAAAAYSTAGQLPEWTGDAVRLCTDAVRRIDALTADVHRRLQRLGARP